MLNSKRADEKHLASVHTKRYIDLIRSISSKEFDSRRLRIASKFNSIYLNNGSSEAAYLAAGSVVEVMHAASNFFAMLLVIVSTI